MAQVPDTDPRFDPRFQRGYDGPQPDAPQTPAAPSPLEGEPVVPLEASGPVDTDPGMVAPDEGDAFWMPPRRNPFALALLISGLAMIAVAGWLVWTVANAPNYPDGYNLNEQIFALVQDSLTPALFIGGILAIVVWLILGGIAASARKGER